MPRAIQHILNRIVSEIIRVPLIIRLFRKLHISLGQIFPSRRLPGLLL